MTLTFDVCARSLGDDRKIVHLGRGSADLLKLLLLQPPGPVPAHRVFPFGTSLRSINQIIGFLRRSLRAFGGQIWLVECPEGDLVRLVLQDCRLKERCDRGDEAQNLPAAVPDAMVSDGVMDWHRRGAKITIIAARWRLPYARVLAIIAAHHLTAAHISACATKTGVAL